ncbi:hypothetical protein [Oceanicola sp. S124]|uniref:hypothetical protein n=1 Tax=Oceanicola sp. S124 TaxID=1042378 RepID=UPI0004947E36|nr:hypothetical protein [Oceanicola sp. S124]
MAEIAATTPFHEEFLQVIHSLFLLLNPTLLQIAPSVNEYAKQASDALGVRRWSGAEVGFGITWIDGWHLACSGHSLGLALVVAMRRELTQPEEEGR